MIHSRFFLSLMCFFAFCKTAKMSDAPKPPEQYTNLVEKPLISTLTIPVSIGIDELVRSINAKMSGNLYEDYSYSDNNSDGLMMTARKSQDVTLHLSGNTIKYRIPLHLWMKKKLVIGEAEAEGNNALGMKTTYKINEDW